jgi:cytoskeletal protein CcmA (bactofilin family)
MTIRSNVTHVIIFFSVLAALLAAASVIHAKISTQSGDRVDAADLLPDMAFLAAADLVVTAKSSDDVFAAGGDISLNGAQADHMIAAGGDIVVSGSTFHDLVIAAGDIDLVSGSVSDDLVAAAGDLNIQSDFNVGGSAIITGGSVTINAPIGGELRAVGADLRLNSKVDGDAHLVGESVAIGPAARIGGDLRHRAGKIEIDPAASIAGEVIILEPPTRPDLEEWGVKVAAAAVAFALAFMIGMGILIMVIALALPALMESARSMIREKPMSTLGIGFLISIAGPAFVALLLVTIFGIPLALLIIILIAAAAPIAIAAFAYFAGMTVRGAATKSASPPGALARAMWSAFAAFGLVILGLIPILGGVVWTVAYIFGLGAVMTRGGKALAMRA